jgi:carboxyl-terminal processing protease
MSNKKTQVWLPLLFSISMAIGIFIGFKMRDQFSSNSFFSIVKSSPFNEIMGLIKDRYVDDVKMNQLSDTAIEALLTKLDPHSVYIAASELEDINNDIEGNFYGIGIEFDFFHDTLNVSQILKDGPAQKAGILSGDQFIKANNILIAGAKMDVDSIRNLLRGARESKLTLTILRDKKMIVVPIQRNLIPINSIDASYMLDRETGFIKINKFSTHTYKEFMTALTELNKKGMNKLILDLRDNGGGVLDEAIEIADEFLSEDKLITYTEGKHRPKKEYRCRRIGQFETGDLKILCDEGSASASEVLMGALQDWDRATIIGRRSFGKGLVQEQYDLSNGAALRLTVARYYSPMGRCIQRDYTNGGKAYYDEIESRTFDGTDSAQQSNQNKNSKIFTTPKGKKLYGGGGITPDIFQASDTASISSTIRMIFSKGLANHYALVYSNRFKSILKQFNSPISFAEKFNFSDNDWNDFSLFSKKDSVDISTITSSDKTYIIQFLKSSIARYTWNKEGYYQAVNVDDEMIKKARGLK